MFNPPVPSKVVILGGGVGSLSTAIKITDDPNWRQRFSSVTVYQMGWRLGGKGASGRGEFGRIEEHGLHVWMGFYENAFRVMREIYKENGRPPGTPLAEWTDAFKKHNFIELMEQYNGTWRKWPLDLKQNDDTPGAGLGIPTLWQHVVRVIELLEEVIASSEMDSKKSWLGKLWDEIKDVLRAIGLGLGAAEGAIAGALVGRLKKHVAGMPADPADHDPKHHSEMLEMLTTLAAKQNERHAGSLDNDLVRHLYVLADFSIACVRGVISSGLIMNNTSLDALDEVDMIDWLKSHGASDTTIQSGLVRGMYDLMFAYVGGDVTKPSFGAGTFLHFAIRMSLTYRGAIFWKMQAGMGDTIFGPIYEVLKKRGVEFKYFHCVDQLHVSANGDNIESVDLNIQATLKPEYTEYDPFVTVNRLKCWPATPNYDQLVQGDALKEQNINLESFWTPWKPVAPPLTLKYGVDYDILVLGIPVGSHPYICSELIAKNSRWSDMVANVQTTRTLAMQLWLQPDLKELGWDTLSPIMDSYVQPFNTWADMSQLIVRESWPTPVKNVAYFCGTMTGGIPPKGDTDAPARETEAVKQAALAWLRKNPGYLWPKASTPDGALDWSKLTDPKNGTGEARFNSQFWRVNIDPTEQYVLSLPKTTKHRLRADNTAFDNLIITGDWTWQPMNVGCVEGTVMSGLMAANVMLGLPIDKDVVGYHRS
ncbi:MAG: NAD(P)-binding protein [Flavobacteriales bacterium]|nr:NAD(P)-binding protein [Flavobacteriales bacterium]